MNDMNKIMCIGRLTRDVELKKTTSGHHVAKCAIALGRKYKDKEDVSFVDITAWGKTAEFIAKYFSKGQKIGIEGSLQQSRWEGTDGKKNSRIEILVSQCYFIEKKTNGSTSQPNALISSNDGPPIDIEDMPF